MSGGKKSLQGRLLLESGQLGDSCFQRSVILICNHDAEGAFGLVLNRAVGKTLGDVVVADFPDFLKSAPLFLGGPVQPGALSYLYTGSFVPGESFMPDIALGHSLDDLLELGGKLSSSDKVRVFSGYSGWSPGQLEGEMKRKSWLTFPASLDLIFETPPETLWQHVLKCKGGWKNKLLAQMPEDLSWN